MAIDLSAYTQSFSDEFTSFNWAGASGTAGTWKTSYYNGDRVLWGNGETEFYSDPSTPLTSKAGYVAPHSIIADASQAGDGILRITASKSPSTADSWGLPYVSGMATTEPSFTQKYGYFEISAKVPDGQGLWPAFWLLPADKSHPVEIDALEYLGAKTASGDGGDTRYWYNLNSSDASYKHGAWVDTGVDLSQGFHRYGVLWTPSYIAYYFDGQEIAGSRVATPPDANKPMYMITNLAVGSNWTGPADASLFTTTNPNLLPHLDIDSIKAWSLPSAKIDLGSGPDTLVINISQDDYAGAAQYTISVDGKQIGGTLSAVAMHGSGLTDAVTVRGDWTAGPHTLTVNFLNDAFGGNGSDRNLYVEGLTYGGVAQPNGTAALLGTGASNLAFTEPGTVPPSGSTTIGSGSDQLILKISQDAYQGSAQYTIKVDGTQIGATLTASALHGSGQADTVTVLGDWTAGGHSVTVTFLNDLYGGSASADRNLYVDGLTYDGVVQPNGTASLWDAGSRSLSFTEPGTTPPPGSTTVGSGSDQLVLKISQDAYQGNAQYTIRVDGPQIGGTLAASASHGSGQADTVTVRGDWTAGAHTVAVTFLNDLYGGSPSADRNLYVEGMTYDGVIQANGTATLWDSGTKNLSFTEAGTPGPTGSATIGTGGDQLVLKVSQDAYQGSAQYTVKVDGTQIGGTLTAGALHGSGQDTVTVLGDWSAGQHNVTVTFLNDLYGGSPTTDRNLYVEAITFDDAATAGGAVPVAGATATLWDAGARDFLFS